MSRGIEVLRLNQGANAASRMKAVAAPSVKRDPLAAKPVASLDRSVKSAGGSSYVCPLFL